MFAFILYLPYLGAVTLSCGARDAADEYSHRHNGKSKEDAIKSLIDIIALDGDNNTWFTKFRQVTLKVFILASNDRFRMTTMFRSNSSSSCDSRLVPTGRRNLQDQRTA